MGEQRKRGFAAMSPEKQRAIARKGGQAAHLKGTAHEFSPEEACRAGHIGGKTISANRAYMAAIGRKGGQRSVQRLLAARASKQSVDTQDENQPMHLNQQDCHAPQEDCSAEDRVNSAPIADKFPETRLPIEAEQPSPAESKNPVSR